MARRGRRYEPNGAFAGLASTAPCITGEIRAELAELDEAAGEVPFDRVLARYRSSTSAERDGWRRQRTAARGRERQREVRTVLTLDLLLDRLHIPRALAEHLVQPYCKCSLDAPGGPIWCDHAVDLGLAQQTP